MKLAELTHVDQLQLELVRHGWQKCLDHQPPTNSAFFVYSEIRCTCCEHVCRDLCLYPQHDDFGTDVVVLADVDMRGRIIRWCFAECCAGTWEEFEPGELGLEPMSIGGTINSWFEKRIA